jgi:hypothetical protein
MERMLMLLLVIRMIEAISGDAPLGDEGRGVRDEDGAGDGPGDEDEKVEDEGDPVSECAGGRELGDDEPDCEADGGSRLFFSSLL